MRSRPDAKCGIFVRLDEQSRKELIAAAEERCISVSYLAGRLIREGLPRLIPVEELTLTQPRDRAE